MVRIRLSRTLLISYSLGDAIDWKLIHCRSHNEAPVGYLLLARGRDRLETEMMIPPLRLQVFLLLARGRDRLETILKSCEANRKSYLLLARGRDRLETSKVN